MVSALDSRSRDLGSSPAWGRRVVGQEIKLYSHSASLSTRVYKA